MPALEQFNGRFAFADTGVPQQKNTLAVDIHKNAVAGNLGSQLFIEIVYNLAGGIHGLAVDAQQGTTMLFRQLQQLRRHLHIPGDDEGRYLAAQQILQHFSATLGGHTLEEHHLSLAQNLQADGLEVLIKPHQLQRRTIDIGDGHGLYIKIRGLIQHLHVKLRHQLRELGRGALNLFHG